MYFDPRDIRTKVVKLSLNDHEKAVLDKAAEFRHQQPAAAAREMFFESGKLRMAWNHVYAQRITEKAGWSHEAALKSAEAADDAFNDKQLPSQAADEEMSGWTNDK